MDDLKLLGRNENGLKNEIKIVQTIIIIIIIIIIGHITQKVQKTNISKYLEQYPQVRKMKSDIQDIVQSNEILD